ncbi:MAG TPA: hypothetical protein ENK67_02295, partial [Flavobacteriia bacterium]|nr:hypothetical protein [Flavobacteriia bacterium]
MPKILKLTYHQIDFTKYDNCIDVALNSRIEAYSWYLDIVTNKNWAVLVLNDYQAVLPLPLLRVKRRFLKKMITQPIFCQQLGLFYKDISENEIRLFVDAFKKESIFQYHFNAQNFFVNHYFTDIIHQKNNYILAINKGYDYLSKNYKKGLKNNLKKAQKAKLIIKKNPSFIDFKDLPSQELTFK